jgi:hypothetical protein
LVKHPLLFHYLELHLSFNDASAQGYVIVSVTWLSRRDYTSIELTFLMVCLPLI